MEAACLNIVDSLLRKLADHPTANKDLLY